MGYMKFPPLGAALTESATKTVRFPNWAHYNKLTSADYRKADISIAQPNYARLFVSVHFLPFSAASFSRKQHGPLLLLRAILHHSIKKKTDFKLRFITTNTLLSFQWHLITKQRTHEKSRRSNPGSSASGGHWQISSCPLVLCPNERFKPSKSSSSLSDKLNGPRWGGVGVSCPELQGESLPREEGLLSEVYFGRRQEDMPCRCSCPAVSEPAGWRRCRSAGEPDSTLATLPSKIRYQINI